MLAVAVAGCREDAPRREQTKPVVRAPTDTQQKVAPVAERRIPDAALELAANRRLARDPAVGPGPNVSVREGVVTLTGTAQHLLAKRRAVESVGLLRGVRSVIDRMSLPRAKASDSALASAVQQALRWEPAIEAGRIEARVEGGRVTLRGTVDSWARSELAETTAAGVVGVRAIDNDIDVDWKVERPDTEILGDVKNRLKMDARLADERIRVAVKDGKVVLSGSVGSLTEKTLAWRDAWVAGVGDVDDSDLNIEWWAREEMQRKLQPSDAEIERAIVASWRLDPRVGEPLPFVAIRKGVVTLTGTVHGVRAERAAIEDAENTSGVLTVHERIRVEPPERVSDAKIAEAVKAALARDPYLHARDLDVEVRAGTVLVSGKVATEFARQHAARVISRIAGVREIDNAILATRTDQPPIRDSAIEVAIEDALYWDPRVAAPSVRVEVRDGVATLSGVVDDWSAYRAAVDAAFQGGARDVENRLSLGAP